MKILLSLILIIFLFSCKKEPELKSEFNKPNVVFYTLGGGHYIKCPAAFSGTYPVTNKTGIIPQCNSYWDKNSGYLILYMKEGQYIVTVMGTSFGDIDFKITIHEKYCNIFDVAHAYGWQ
jgi:hypothetical protein